MSVRWPGRFAQVAMGPEKRGTRRCGIGSKPLVREPDFPGPYGRIPIDNSSGHHLGHSIIGTLIALILGRNDLCSEVATGNC